MQLHAGWHGGSGSDRNGTDRDARRVLRRATACIPIGRPELLIDERFVDNAART